MPAPKNYGYPVVDWSKFPDHDPDYLAGRITLEQANARHPRPDNGCGCPNCKVDRRRAEHQRQPAPMPEVRCVICQGTGYQGWPAGMGWTPCRACAAEELFRLQEETFHVRSEFGNHQMATVLRAARERVASCAECQGTGKTWEPIPAAPCPACRGTGRDNHMGMPPGVLWPRADGDFAKDTSGGRVPEQVTHWTADAETEPGAMAEPAAASMPEASDVPAFMTARAVGQRITYSRGA